MTARDRRALVLGGSVVLATVFILRVLPWTMRRGLAAHAQLRDRSALLVRARADLADAAVLRDSAARLAQALVGLAPKILGGSTQTEAVADLSDRLSLAAFQHHAKLERVDAVADSGVAGRLRRAGIRAAFESDIRGLVGVLRAVEFGAAVLPIRELRVTVADLNPSDRAAEILRVEVTVMGWYLVPLDAGQ